MFEPERHRRGDPHQAAWSFGLVGRFGFGGLAFGQDARGAAERGLAGFG